MHSKIELRKKILTESYINGIYNTSRIEDRLGLKLNTIEYVLEKLKEEKLIVKERYLINLSHFKLNNFAWIFISVNWAEIDEKELLNKLTSLHYVHTISEITGEYDIAIKVIGKSYEKLNEYVAEIEKILSNDLVDVQTYYSNKEIKSHYLKFEEIKNFPIKKMDNILILEKNNNPKISILEIAKKYKFHRNTLSKRWAELKNHKVILKKTVELSYEGYKFINLGLKAFVIIRTYPGKNDEVIKNLLTEDKVQDVFTTLSNALVAIIRAEDSQELSIIHKRISKFEAVKRTQTIIFLKKYTKSGITSRDLSLLTN